MKIVYNGAVGGFMWSDVIYEKFKLTARFGDDLKDRTNESIIACLEQLDKEEIRHLCICEIPDEATDWMVGQYDGLETVYYVLDGKIRNAT